ncbi:ferredoxin [Mycobacterium sp. CBMA293]|uniref:ferredoxin n=1 Tax=unclassified Mycolicibacterium TaxID=2636767 RepID=UPI0012DCE9A6|nr:MULTISPECIES: ferredoxin [unclassified Mycolicibacterium]MUL47405.1 ferredoxin [Mycolicibacterium sp. CBMA 360]MUL59390.1 ferredoxin [Mycolicibacterium sp. CBMA 335]MUL71115.1 ferredoxin [Mycolicibacterium sp. CBMA 311]MUL94758.1 ferredoxin [Mycolicibacterium sp. CBMA 230]MUM03599.1 hypothetical protein [Mycolicibacterium sp. CBMA 213]
MATTHFSATVDDGICMGAGYCYGTDPDLFAENDDGTARFPGPPQADSLHRIKKASQVCPSGAIEIHYQEDPA